MARYQDLTREQAVGLEARVLQRLPPVMEIALDASAADVQAYFSALLSASYLLAEIAIGNRSFGDAKVEIEELNHQLHRSSFLSERSQSAAECPLLILNGAGAPGRVEYFPNPGLHERDRRNPELSMALGMAAWSLSKIGMTEDTFMRPSECDCDFALRDRSRSSVCLEPSFFARTLWPEGTPYGINNLLMGRWSDRMQHLGLDGLAHSFRSCANGIFLTAKKSQSPGETSMVNNVTLNFSNGSNFTGPLAVGQNIQIAYKAASEVESKGLEENLKNLVDITTRMMENLASEDDKLETSMQVKTLVEEAKKDKPSKWLVGASASGLIETAGKIAGMVEPLSKAITAVTNLLP